MPVQMVGGSGGASESVVTGALASHQPSDQSYKAWSFDPIFGVSSVTLTGGVVNVIRVPLPESFTCVGVDFGIATVGASLTYARFSINGENRAQLLLSGDQTTNWASGTGLKQHTITATPLVGGPGRFCFVCLLTTGTTQPTFIRAGTSNSALVNSGLTSSSYRMATGGSSQTSMPSTPTLTSGGSSVWVGLR